MTATAETECLADKLNPGDVVGGKYEIEAILGRGGMGLVLSAIHQQLEERVALKFLTSSADRVPSARSRFMREARVTAKLRGEHAARVSDFGALEDGTPYMVMEFLDGTDLRQLLRDQKRLPVDVAIHYLVQACEGLAEAHARGIVHRDLKPSNLFLTKRPDGTDLVKIVDFGISKLRTTQNVEEDLTAAGAILGSPRYVAPEQLCNSGQVDSRADVWSLGAILYELLSGRPPFHAESTAALCYVILGNDQPEPLAGRIEGVSEQLEEVVLRCLTRAPEDRTSDVAALVADLYDATGTEGLDGLSQSIRGILHRGAAEGLNATGAFGTTGSNPSARKQRVLGSSDSGSVRNEFSAGSQPGMATSQHPRAQRKPAWYAVASLVVAALIGGVVWTQLPHERSAPVGSTGGAGVAAVPGPASAAVSAEPSDRDAPATSGDAGDVAPETTLVTIPAAPDVGVPSKPTGSGRQKPPSGTNPEGEASYPPKGAHNTSSKETPKKPRDPFGDRY